MKKYKVNNDFEVLDFKFSQGDILECDQVVLNIIYHWDNKNNPIRKIRSQQGAEIIFEYIKNHTNNFESIENSILG